MKDWLGGSGSGAYGMGGVTGEPTSGPYMVPLVLLSQTLEVSEGDVVYSIFLVNCPRLFVRL